MCGDKPEDKKTPTQVDEPPGRSLDAWIGRLREIAVAELGAELIEFAMIVPLLLMLLLGVVWIGRAFNVYATITRAAREGVRYAVLPSSVAAGNSFADTLSTSCSSGTNAYNNYVVPALTADSLDPAKVKNYCQKTKWLETTYPEQCGVVMSFSYPLELDIPFTNLNATTIDIKANAQMRLEDQSAGGTSPCSP